MEPIGGGTTQELELNGSAVELSWAMENLIDPDDFELMCLTGDKLGLLIRNFKNRKKGVRSLMGVPILSKLSDAAGRAHTDYIHSIKWAETEQSTITNSIDLLAKELDRIVKEVGILESEQDAVKLKLDEARKELEIKQKRLDEDADTIDKDLAGLQDDLKGINSELEEKERDFKELQDLLPNFLLIDEYKKKIEEQKRLLGEDSLQFHRKFGYLEGGRDALRKYAGKVKPDKEIRAEVKSIQKEIDAILNSLPGGKLPTREEFRELLRAERAIDFVKYLEKQREKAPKYKDMKEEILVLKAKQTSLNKKIDDTIQVLKRRTTRPSDIERLEGNVEKLNAEIAGISGKLDVLRKDRDRKMSERRESIEKLNRYSKMGGREAVFSKRAEKLKDFFDELLSEHEMDKIAKINKISNDLFSKIIQKPEWYTGMELTSDYEVKVKEMYRPKAEVPKTRPSSGEMDVIALCIALALNIESGNKMVILDDATIHLDEAYTKKVLEAVNRFGFEQTIVAAKDTIEDMVIKKLKPKLAYEVSFDPKTGCSDITKLGD
jgi:DNA repair exonuclease SbcCD ATPase subunit